MCQIELELYTAGEVFLGQSIGFLDEKQAAHRNAVWVDREGKWWRHWRMERKSAILPFVKKVYKTLKPPAEKKYKQQLCQQHMFFSFLSLHTPFLPISDDSVWMLACTHMCVLVCVSVHARDKLGPAVPSNPVSIRD